MKLTLEQLAAIFPNAGNRVSEFLEPITAAMEEFGVITAPRVAAFLAQYGHETGEFHYMQEIADGRAYEGRADLGNIHEGDGQRFKGRGLPMLTGRDNYSKCGDALGLNLLTFPELLEQTTPACRAGGWYWKNHNLNAFADDDRFFALTHAINGGYNGGDSRLHYWLRARRALGIP